MTTNEKIQLSVEELTGQAESMRQLKDEYEAMFTQVTSILNDMNSGWSENLANNFLGKISVAQKSFAKIVEMLATGENVAKESAKGFEDLNAIMARSLAQTSYSDGMGMQYTYEEVQAAKERVESGNYTRTDIRIANAKLIDLSDFWDNLHTGSWTKQDILLNNGGGFTLEGENLGIMDTLISQEEQIFGTDYLSHLSDIVQNFQTTTGNVFENGFGKIETLLETVTPLVSTGVQGDHLGNQFSNFEVINESFIHSNTLEALVSTPDFLSGLGEFAEGLPIMTNPGSESFVSGVEELIGQSYGVLSQLF